MQLHKFNFLFMYSCIESNLGVFRLGVSNIICTSFKTPYPWDHLSFLNLGINLSFLSLGINL